MTWKDAKRRAYSITYGEGRATFPDYALEIHCESGVRLSLQAHVGAHPQIRRRRLHVGVRRTHKGCGYRLMVFAGKL